MKKFILIAFVAGMTSCLSMNRPDYTLWESYQIGNFSSQDVTVSFYEQGALKMVYAEMNDRGFVTDFTTTVSKLCTDLWSGTEMTLAPGQTAVLYHYYTSPKDTLPRLYASNMSGCGQSDNALYLFHEPQYYFGDSVTVSLNGAEAIPIPIRDGASWETWYDERNFIYYHYRRITE